MRNDRTPLAAGLVACVAATSLVAGACAAVKDVPEPATHAALTSAQKPDIATVTWSGSGCPSQEPPSIRTVLSDDGTSVTVRFEDFGAEPSFWRAKASSSCKLSVEVAGVEGVEYAPESLVFTGSGELPRNGRATITTVASWTDAATGSVTASQSLTGPLDGEREVRFGGDLPAWSPCTGERKLKLANAIETTRGSFRIDALQGLTLRARRCDEGTVPAQPDGGDTKEPPSPEPTKPDGGTTTPPAPTNGIESVTTEGPGCPTGMSTASVGADGLSFSMQLGGLSLATTTEASSRLISKRCTVVVNLKQSSTHAYFLESVAGHGDLAILEGQQLVMMRSYASIAQSVSPKAVQLQGPSTEAIRFADSYTASEAPQVGCGSTYFRLSLSLSLYNSTPPAVGTVSLTDLDQVKFGLRSCAP